MKNFMNEIVNAFRDDDPALTAKLDAYVKSMPLDELRAAALVGLLMASRNFYNVFRALTESLAKQKVRS